MKRPPIAFLPLLAVLVGACSLFPGASISPRDMALRQLADHQARWTSKNLDDYTLTVTRQCFCPSNDPVDITVVDGIVTAATSGGKPVEAFLLQTLPKTVPELFAMVAAQADAAALTVEWDETFGFPTSIQVDSIANAVDDEFGIQVTNFRPAS